MPSMRSVGRRICQIFHFKPANDEISFFDVKELYNEAYEYKATARNALKHYKRMEARAKELDAAYRLQLTRKTPKSWRLA